VLLVPKENQVLMELPELPGQPEQLVLQGQLVLLALQEMLDLLVLLDLMD
jgi:hypothetical protein